MAFTNTTSPVHAVEQPIALDFFGDPVPAGFQPLDAIVRVSKTGTREYLNSPDQQTADVRRGAAAQGCYVAQLHLEIDESGKTTDRPALNAARQRALSGATTGVIAAYLSRFSRNTVEGLELVQQLLNHGRRFVALDCTLDLTTPEGKAMLTYQLANAQMEWERARNNFGRNVREAIAKGVHVSIPYGYQRSAGKGTKLAPVPAEAELLRRMYEQRAMDWSWERIAAAANETGPMPRPWRRKRGEAPVPVVWSGNAVAKLLRNQAYMGVAWNGDHVTVDAHPAIVSESLWRQANAARGTRPARPEDGYLLTSLLRCGSCGYAMVHTGERRTLASGEVREYRYYRCTVNHGAGGKCAAPAKITAAEAERLMGEAFDSRYLSSGGPEADLMASDEGVTRAVEARERAERELRGVVRMGRQWESMSPAEQRIHEDELADARAALHAAEQGEGAARAQVRGASLPLDLTAASRPDLPIPTQRHFLASVFAFGIVTAGSDPADDRLAIVLRDQAPDDGTVREWITSGAWMRTVARVAAL